MLRVIDQTEKEVKEMYQKATKTELIDMLVECNKHLDTLVKNCNLQNVTNRFKITAVRHDDMDAFGAYASSSIESEEGGVVLLNVEGTIGTCMEHEIEPKQMIIETLMHEFGHALEEWYKCDFDEDRIERIIESYRRKNGW